MPKPDDQPNISYTNMQTCEVKVKKASTHQLCAEERRDKPSPLGHQCSHCQKNTDNIKVITKYTYHKSIQLLPKAYQHYQNIRNISHPSTHNKNNPKDSKSLSTR